MRDVTKEKYQISLFSTHEDTIHIVNVYRSHGADTNFFLCDLESMILSYEPCYIVGDFNIDYFSDNHRIPVWISNQGFCQLVKTSTHEEGGLLDQVYIKALGNHKVHLHWPYYSDHAAICVQKLH